jgi:hypothetical protein
MPPSSVHNTEVTGSFRSLIAIYQITWLHVSKFNFSCNRQLHYKLPNPNTVLYHVQPLLCNRQINNGVMQLVSCPKVSVSSSVRPGWFLILGHDQFLPHPIELLTVNDMVIIYHHIVTDLINVLPGNGRWFMLCLVCIPYFVLVLVFGDRD